MAILKAVGGNLGARAKPAKIPKHDQGVEFVWSIQDSRSSRIPSIVACKEMATARGSEVSI